jgi:hypothetical protein
MPRFINRPPKKATISALPKTLDPTLAVKKPPRLKPATTREYGKGGTPYSGAPDFGIRGAGIKYGGI